jgi:hypothetical protein
MGCRSDYMETCGRKTVVEFISMKGNAKHHIKLSCVGNPGHIGDCTWSGNTPCYTPFCVLPLGHVVIHDINPSKPALPSAAHKNMAAFAERKFGKKYAERYFSLTKVIEDPKPPVLSQIEVDVLLCSACRVLARLGYDFEENPALSRWWDTHKKKDARDT